MKFLVSNTPVGLCQSLNDYNNILLSAQQTIPRPELYGADRHSRDWMGGCNLGNHN